LRLSGDVGYVGADFGSSGAGKGGEVDALGGSRGGEDRDKGLGGELHLGGESSFWVRRFW
jgi:hypothetical protein